MQSTQALPKLSPENEFFWQGCAKQQLTFQTCRKCGFIRWPPSDICPECHATETDYIVAQGRGKIYSYAVFHQHFHLGFKAELPYVVAIVELEEGPKVLTNLINCDPEIVNCEMPVIVKWVGFRNGISLPKFEPVVTRSDPV